MLNAFLNPWMLAGLAGILLPVIAHLLSRKKYDIVDWGAMQFLQLDPSAKRKIRLEELLLLLVRMGLIALVALAFARPWLGSQWLMGLAATESRDVVLIIDQSYSMGWDAGGNRQTTHSRAIQMAREFLRSLRPGDAIQIIEAREQPQLLLPDATRDHDLAREILNERPYFSGTANMVAAIQKAVQVLSSSTNLRREILVFTDLQALGWKCDDAGAWSRLDDNRTQSSIAPRIWVVDAATDELGRAANFAVERLQMPRELAFIDSPVKFNIKVKYQGGDSPVARQVHLEIDQLRVDDRTVQIKLQPNGETTVDFEYRFQTVGSHLVSVVLDDDPLPGDNRADAVVTVADSIPVLLIDGDQNPDPTRCETYFAHAALKAGGTGHSWIKPTVMTPDQITIERLQSAAVVIVANVATLSDPAISGLQKFAASGRGVLFTLGNQVHREHYRTVLYEAGEGLFPCRLEAIVDENEQEKRGVRILSEKLDLPWLKPFRADRGGTLTDARWSHWWKVTLPSQAQHIPKTSDEPQSIDQIEPDTPANEDGLTIEFAPAIGTSVSEILLTTGDPLLVTRRYGRGIVAVLTSSLDADWNTLPAKQDYVPFLHELLFSLLSNTTSRNLDVGSPLIFNLADGMRPDEYEFQNPARKPVPFDLRKDAFQTTIRLRNTILPGVYRFGRKIPKPLEPLRDEFFVVNVDRDESVLTRLSEAEKQSLENDGRMKFVSSIPELRKNLFAAGSRTEIWWLIVYIFVGNLALETWLTRRMLRGL